MSSFDYIEIQAKHAHDDVLNELHDHHFSLSFYPDYTKDMFFLEVYDGISSLTVKHAYTMEELMVTPLSFQQLFYQKFKQMMDDCVNSRGMPVKKHAEEELVSLELLEDEINDAIDASPIVNDLGYKVEYLISLLFNHIKFEMYDPQYRHHMVNYSITKRELAESKLSVEKHVEAVLQHMLSELRELLEEKGLCAEPQTAEQDRTQLQQNDFEDRRLEAIKKANEQFQIAVHNYDLQPTMSGAAAVAAAIAHLHTITRATSDVMEGDAPTPVTHVDVGVSHGDEDFIYPQVVSINHDPIDFGKLTDAVNSMVEEPEPELTDRERELHRAMGFKVKDTHKLGSFDKNG